MADLFLVNQSDPVPVHPQNGTAFTLEEMQAFVGGYIEMYQHRDGRLWVWNEEGRLRDMPLNIPASVMAGFEIVGPAVLVTPQEASSDE